jgi:hypothetical protein
LALPGHPRNCTNVHYTESGNVIIGRICLARYWLILPSALLAHSAYFMLGHKTLAMVKRYAHLSEAHTHGVVERRNRAVFGEP